MKINPGNLNVHEMSIALNIVDLGLQTAKHHQAERINAIILEIGSLSGVVKEALEFCYESACKDTIAEGSRLDLVHIPARARCETCKAEFEADSEVPNCPSCGELVFHVEGGRELRVKSINVD